MPNIVRPAIARRRLVAVACAALLAASPLSPAASALESPAPGSGPKPTIVLVHGVFADSSAWSGVIERLDRRGYRVIAAANPLRDVAGDSAYLASVLKTIPGPIVLAGHSYGGTVITNAATGNPNVKALVYVAAFAPDKGETSLELAYKFPGSDLPDALVVRPFPMPGGGTGEDVYLDPAKYRAVFAADVPEPDTRVMAVTQRPGALAGATAPSGAPAWKSIASWALVPTADRTIPPAAQLWMARRAQTRVVQARGASHMVMVSRPALTARLILEAAEATG